ncbi:MAG: ABC transporter permease, partial [Myxococcales bacterium]|nr:ABC transporter permease [Myxococcales bacterium]
MKILTSPVLLVLRLLNEHVLYYLIGLFDGIVDAVTRRFLGRLTLARLGGAMAVATVLGQAVARAAGFWIDPSNPMNSPAWLRAVAFEGAGTLGVFVVLLVGGVFVRSVWAPFLAPFRLILWPVRLFVRSGMAAPSVVLQRFGRGFEWTVAVRYLKSRRQSDYLNLITMISIGGIAVGVMALIIVLEVMSGFERDLKDKILGTSAHIMVTQKDGEFTDWRSVLKTVEDDAEIEVAAPFVESQVILSNAGVVSSAAIRGVDPKRIGHVSRLIAKMYRGSVEALGPRSDGARPGIVLGRELAREIGAYMGDGVEVISPFGIQTPLGPKPRVREFEVVGIFESGLYEYDSGRVYIELAQAQDFFDFGDAVSGIEARVRGDVHDARDVRKELERVVPSKYEVRDWGQLNRSLFSALQLERFAMFMILTLTILVAAFNIVSTLIMVVMEKREQIAVLKTMGATGARIRRIFMLEGLLIGVVGILTGGTLGILGCEALAR